MYIYMAPNSAPGAPTQPSNTSNTIHYFVLSSPNKKSSYFYPVCVLICLLNASSHLYCLGVVQLLFPHCIQ